MPQLNIYVSDDLAERVKSRKAELNVSKVCADALDREVTHLEIYEKVGQDMQSVIERLRVEKTEVETSWYRRGYGEAESWVRRAKYDEFKRYGEWQPSTPDFYEMQFAVPGEVRDEIENDLDNEAYQDQQSAGEEYREDRAPYIVPWHIIGKGWHDRVREVWAQIKDQL